LVTHLRWMKRYLEMLDDASMHSGESANLVF